MDIGHVCISYTEEVIDDKPLLETQEEVRPRKSNTLSNTSMYKISLDLHDIVLIDIHVLQNIVRCCSVSL